MRRPHGFSKAAAVGCLLAALCISTGASAQQPPAPAPVQWSQRGELHVELRLPSYLTSDPSFDALSDDEQYTGGLLAVGYDLDKWTRVPGLRGYLAYAGGGLSPSRFDGQMQLDWNRALFMAMADWGPQLWGFVRPSVRLGAGYALQSLDVTTTGATKSDYAHDLAGLGSLGLEVSTPHPLWGSMRLGLTGEFGYLAQTTATFDELGGSSGGWNRQEAALGDLNANGWFWDVGVGLSFAL